MLTINNPNHLYLNFFNDYGMVWQNKTKPTQDDNSIRASYGFGIKYYSPIGPIGLSWGFPLIDESYDIIEDKEQRWIATLDSMQKLSLLDPVDVYRQLADVLEHNKQHFETHDWKRAIKWDSYD